MVLSIVEGRIACIGIRRLRNGLLLEIDMLYWSKMRSLIYRWLLQVMGRLRLEHNLRHYSLCLQLMSALLMTHSWSLNCTLVVLDCLSLLAVHTLALFLNLWRKLCSNARRSPNLREDPLLELNPRVTSFLPAQRITAATSANHLRLRTNTARRGPTTVTFLHSCLFHKFKNQLNARHI